MTRQDRRSPGPGALLPPPAPPSWWKRRRVIAAIAGAGALVVGVVLVVVFLPDASRCAAGVTRVSVPAGDDTRKECVGVTDSYPFDPRLRQATDVMREENEFATKGGPGTYVTVAFLGVLTSTDPRVVHQVEGAVTAQHRVNQEDLIGDRPRIKLLLANMDSREGHWSQVADELVRRVDSDDHLVAVAGLGLSQSETMNAARRMSGAGLPMVGDVVTASVFNKNAVNGFARVNPSTQDEVKSLAQYLNDTHPRGYRAMLVSSSKENDLYTAALTREFKQFMNAALLAGGSVENPFGENPAGEFETIVRNLCSTEHRPDVVFYAGRAVDLPTFISYLGQRNCRPGEITVVTGSDAVRLILDTSENRKAGRALMSRHNPISLEYAPLVEPSVVLKSGGAAADQYNRFQRAFRGLRFDTAHLPAAWGIMSHDAVVAATRAIRLAAGNSGRLPTPAQVRGQLYLMSSAATSAPGASGEIRLDPATGNRVGLQLPALKLRPGREPEVLGR